jgi:ankyrin repeat protein
LKAKIPAETDSFLLATLQLRKILEPTTRAELEELLHHLPKSADEFYRDVMDEIMDQPSVRSRLALQTFVWLCESARSLRVQELRHALAIREHKTTMDERDLPSLQTIQTVCKQMVSVDRLGQRIALLHPTFREFLNRNQERYFPDVMTQLAKAVITYLQYDELKSGPSESLEEFKWRLGKMPFLPYVAQYWGHYLVAAYRNQEVRESTLSILRSQPLLDTLSQFYVTAKSHRLFPDRFKDAPKNVNGLHMAGVFGLADAARTLISANPGLVAARDSWKRTPLHIAATNGQYAVAKLLLDHKAPTNAQDRNRKTPLHEAAASGHEDIVCLLLGERADPTVKDEEGLTALDQAAAGGQVEVVGKLLEATKECPMEKASAVRKAAEKGQSQMVEVLLDQGVTPDASILNSAAGAGIQETVSTLLERGLDPNAQDEQGRTALHAAASAGNTQIVEQLLESGASLCVSDEQDKTPLFFAVGSGDENMVRRLVDEGADIDARTTTGETALFHAAATGQIGIVKLLLSFGAAVNTIQKPISDQVHTGLDSPCGQYYTPLHAAAAEGHRQIVESLISCGAEIELEDARGLRPIHLAAENGCTEVLEFLISCCCALSPKDAEGRTPLHLAARAGQLEAVNLLLSTGDVDCNTPDKHSRTPLSYACENQQEDVVDSLLKVVEDVESGDAQGKTPLSYAVAAGNVRIVSGLLARIPGGPTGQNKSVSTALEYARKEGNQAIVELLEAKG